MAITWEEIQEGLTLPRLEKRPGRTRPLADCAEGQQNRAPIPLVAVFRFVCGDKT